MRKVFLVLAFAVTCFVSAANAGGGADGPAVGVPPTCDPNCQWVR